MNEQLNYQYDVFLSYSSHDEDWVQGKLLLEIEKTGLQACIDKRDFTIGMPEIKNREQAIRNSRKTLLVLTPAYLQSGWTEFENLILQTPDPNNQSLRLIPLLKEECDLPPRISYLTPVYFTNPENEDIAWRQLLTALGKPPSAEPPEAEPPEGWFLAHPYLMPPNFTGRLAERQMLSQWLERDATHSLLVLQALGGFGKSALTWHWLNHDIDQNRWQKVIWWSFYEASARFESFLPKVLAYLTGEDISRLPPRQQLDQLLHCLEQPNQLLILDGFERELRAYGNMGAAYQGDEVSPVPETSSSSLADKSTMAPPSLADKSTMAPPSLAGKGAGGLGQTDCLNPLATEFLRRLATLPNIRSKVLMSTRLRPAAVEIHGEILQRCREEALTQMQPEDAVAFFQVQGIRGNRAEIEAACRTYGFHPLSLRLLAGWVNKDLEQPGDIGACRHLDVFEDLVQRQHHVLEQSYESLNPERRLLLGKIACFRSPVTYQVLVAVAQGESEGASLAPLQENLHDLLDRGLLQRDRRTNRFDLHPIVRRYAYDRLSSSQRTSAHHELRDYFAAIPTPERVQTLDELNPAIELYHHLVGAGEYDEAWQIYYERIWNAIYYQFGAYQLEIELLRALFPQGENQPPQLSNERARAWTLNELANSYSLSGQPAQAVPLFQQAAAIDAREDKSNWAIDLGNLAQAQIPIGVLQAAESNLRRSIALCQEIGGEFWGAVGHHQLGRLLAYRGAWDESEAELAAALEFYDKEQYIQAQGVTWAYKSLRSLLLSRATSQQQAVAAALAQARRALELAEVTARDTRYVYPVGDFVRAYWLLGAAECANGNLEESDTHLTEALTRCRTINLVEAEADILLDLARLRVIPPSPPLEGGNRIQSASFEGGFRGISTSENPKSLAQEALAIAERCGYVLQQADIHLFLAQLAQQEGDEERARFHARQARQFATCDGGEHTYKVVYEAAMNFL